ncbi:amino acid transporter, partial [Sporormia fimetaria CBS 119925]
PNRLTFTRALSALDGFALLISIVIGSGVFSSPGPIDSNVPSPGAALLIWLLGGTLAWTGALTLAELGTCFPAEEGGIQPFLTRLYGEVCGFLAAWSWIGATMPATLAILSLVFVESVCSAFGWKVGEGGEWGRKVGAIWVLVVVGVLNSVSTKVSTRLGKVFVVVKFATIGLLGVAGLVTVFAFVGSHRRKDWGGRDWHTRNWFAARDVEVPGGGRIEWSKVGAWESMGYYSAALYAALWAYSGWDKANYVSAELQNPTKQLPLSINTAIPTIMACYVAANTVYYVLLPWSVVSTTDAAAVTAVTHFLGRTASIFATILICLVILGSALGNSFVAGRMTVAAANKRWLPSFLGSVGHIGSWRASRQNPGSSAEESDESPINAIILTHTLSIIYILLGNMRILLTFNGLGEYFFFFLTVVGAIKLRFQNPGLHRPIKPFIGVPVLFALIAGFVVVRGAVFAPVPAVVLAGIWALGLV